MFAIAVLTALSAAPLDVAVLSKPVDGSTIEARWLPLGGTDVPEPFARLEAAVDETFHAVVIPRTRSLAVVRVPALTRDLTFAATLEKVTPGAPAQLLARNVARASKPVIAAGRLFVERGEPGMDRFDGSMRIARLTIDEVDPNSGRLRTIHRASGSWTHLAGAVGRELIVYEAAAEGARLLAVHVDTGAVRPLITSMPALAHDFWVDARTNTALFTIAEPGVERWYVERVELGSGHRTRLAEGDSVALLPALLPGGAAISSGPGRGLEWSVRGGVAVSAHGTGYERVRAVVEHLTFLRHEGGSVPPFIYAVRTSDGRDVRVPWPSDGPIVELAGASR